MGGGTFRIMWDFAKAAEQFEPLWRTGANSLVFSLLKSYHPKREGERGGGRTWMRCNFVSLMDVSELFFLSSPEIESTFAHSEAVVSHAAARIAACTG